MSGNILSEGPDRELYTLVDWVEPWVELWSVRVRLIIRNCTAWPIFFLSYECFSVLLNVFLFFHEKQYKQAEIFEPLEFHPNL